MLRAGATRVLWLRTRREALAESVPALLAGLPPDQPLICESNSARTVITPGCFLILRRADDPEIKASCRQVLSLADRLITIQGRQWDTSPDDLTFAGGHWWWRQEATAIILAGGQSRRMGQDKSMLDFGGQPLIAHIAGQVRPHFRHLLIGANAPDRYAFLDAPVIADQLPGQGPLMGLASCLAAAPTEFVFLTGCDIPTADTRTIYALLAALEHQDAVIPVTPDGQRHPLFAAYRRTPALTAARAALADGRRRMAELPARLRVAWYEIGAAPWFRNLNTPEEYAAVRATSQGTATP
jgi:molybdopterin-guanine dinucleotide biosynthesis protein A